MYYSNPNIYATTYIPNSDEVRDYIMSSSNPAIQYSPNMPSSYEEAQGLYAHNSISKPKTIRGIITFADGLGKDCSAAYYSAQIPDMYKSIIFGKWRSYWYRITIYNDKPESVIHYWNGCDLGLLSYPTAGLNIKNIVLDILESTNNAKMMDTLDLLGPM